MTSPIPPVKGGLRLAAKLGPRGLLEFTRLALLSVRRMSQEQFDGEGAALLLTGNTMHADLGPDVPPGGFLGWMLTGLGQEFGFPVPEGGAGPAHRRAGAAPDRAGRDRAVQRAGDADRGARPARGRGRAGRRRDDQRAPRRARRRRCARALPRPRGRGAPAGAGGGRSRPVPVRPGHVQGRLGALGSDPVAHRGGDARGHRPRVRRHGRLHPGRGRPRAGPHPRAARSCSSAR